jgi:hypothetical protein
MYCGRCHARRRGRWKVSAQSEEKLTMGRLRIVPIFLSLAVFCTIASACALTNALTYGRPKFQAEISYTPPPQNESTRLVGVENVRVVVSDERPSKAVFQEPYFGHPGDQVSFAPLQARTAEWRLWDSGHSFPCSKRPRQPAAILASRAN